MEGIEKKKIRLLGNVLGMETEIWPKELYHWKHNRIRKRGWPTATWKENMVTAIRARGLNIEDAQDQRLWKFGMGK